MSDRLTDGDPHPPVSEEKAITILPAIEPVVTTVTIGVDTHKDLHVAVALDTVGRRLAERTTPATAAGYQQLYHWAEELGDVEASGSREPAPTEPDWRDTYVSAVAVSSRSIVQIAAPVTARASPIPSTPRPLPAPSWPAPRQRLPRAAVMTRSRSSG